MHYASSKTSWRPRGGEAVPKKRQSWKVDEFNVKITRGFINRKNTKEDIFTHPTTNLRQSQPKGTKSYGERRTTCHKSWKTWSLHGAKTMMRPKVIKRVNARPRHEKAPLVQCSSKNRPRRLFWLIRNPPSFPFSFFPFRFQRDDGRKS